jgi:hypothetical protein
MEGKMPQRLSGLLHRIDHVVVLMYENCSFDHMLGHLPYGGQLTGTEFNLLDPADPASERVPVTSRATYRTLMDPHHDLLSVEHAVVRPPVARDRSGADERVRQVGHRGCG